RPARPPRPIPGPTRPGPPLCASPCARRSSSRSHPRPRRRASDPPNLLRGNRALVLLLRGLALVAEERERRGWPYTGPRRGHFLLKLGGRSLPDRDRLSVSLRGLSTTSASGQQAPGPHATAVSRRLPLPSAAADYRLH